MAAPSIGMIHPLVLPPYLLFQMRTFVALKQFKNEKASTNSAKQVKRTAYYPFVILLMGFFGTTVQKRFEERRLRDDELYGFKV